MKIKDVQKAVKELAPLKSSWPTPGEATVRSKKTHAVLMGLLRGHRAAKHRIRAKADGIAGHPKIISR